jgi:D-alanyl-D-alanine carboxypeptidase
VLILVLLSGVHTPAFAQQATIAAAPTAAASVDPQEVAPYLGYYSPNTFIELRGQELWFVRHPVETRLLPAGEATYVVEEGWLAGRSLRFVPTEDGTISLQILADDGNWYPFARSGEIYTDLDPALRAALGRVLDNALNDPDIPGVVMYVHIPGKGMWVGARGLSNRSMFIPMIPSDRFRIASITKTFVATMVLQLVDEGRLTLDDTVEQWFPGLVPRGDQMTVRHLLNHTSGLHDYLDYQFDTIIDGQRSRMWRPEEIVAYAVSYPASFAPGEPGRWQYSNTNYILLGMIIEQATGSSLTEQLHARIIDPLQLQNTFLDGYEEIPGGVARGYLGSLDYTDLNMSFAWAAGGMVSNAEDLGRFAQALFGGELLSQQSFEQMLSFIYWDRYGTGNYPIYGLGMMQDIVSFETNMGLPQRPSQATFGGVWGHTGALTGYRSAMGYLHERQITIVVGINQMYVNPTTVVVDALNTIAAHP